MARRCSINAALGREKLLGDIIPTEKRKKVMIIGGGPAGMEAARISALRCHEVTIYDNGNELGGQLILAATPPGKSKWLWFRDYLMTQLKKLEVNVVLNMEVTPEFVRKAKPDVVIIATGSEPLTPDIQGTTRKKTVNAWDVLRGKLAAKDKNILIIGGGTVGCETAEYLSELGNKVTIVEMLSRLADDMESFNRRGLLDQFEKLKVSTIVGKKAVEVHDDGVIIADMKTDKEEHISADQVILAMGVKPVNKLAETLKEVVPELYVVGDCAVSRRVIDAVYEGALSARQI
jgi:NADPH-dependent 2,4-dienoyl-CoA reductase/sulfur reductase-like enzyme